MSELFHIASMYPNADVQVLVQPDATGNILAPLVWTKPSGKTMCQLVLVGAGGAGGAGAIPASGVGGGGGGGGSGGQTVLRFPLWAVPDRLAFYGIKAFNFAVIYLINDNQLLTVFAQANYGGDGGNASTGTGGTGGTAAAAAPTGSLGAQWYVSRLAGQAGAAGGSSDTAGVSVPFPTTGICVTGGGGGGAVGLSSGLPGGVVTPAGAFLTHPTPSAITDPTAKPPDGISGHVLMPNLLMSIGGSGGFGGMAGATGAGLQQTNGGNGAPGCGGGGSGGALTGSTPGTPGKGGPAFAIFTCW